MCLKTFSSEIGIHSCGKYQFKGTPKIKGTEIVIAINEQSLSEINLKVSPKDESKIIPYVDKTIVGEVMINKRLNQWTSEISKFIKIDFSFPDPLNPQNNSYLKLIKKGNCQ
jgi:hypothetical protein